VTPETLDDVILEALKNKKDVAEMILDYARR
jgi:hypothetical protein